MSFIRLSIMTPRDGRATSVEDTLEALNTRVWTLEPCKRGGRGPKRPYRHCADGIFVPHNGEHRDDYAPTLSPIPFQAPFVAGSGVMG